MHFESIYLIFYFYDGAPGTSGAGPLHYPGLTISLRHTTFRRITLDEWSARRRDLYLTTQHSQQTSMTPAVFEPANPASKRAQTLTLDRAATGTGIVLTYCIKYMYIQYTTLVTSIRHVSAAQFHHQLVHSKLKTIHSEMNHIYVLSVHSAANTNTSVYVDKIRGFPAFCNTTRHSGTPSFLVRGSQHMFMYILP
jgi:hypothetical protein